MCGYICTILFRHSVQTQFGCGSPHKGKSGVIPVLAIILSRYWRTSAGNRSPRATPSLAIRLCCDNRCTHALFLDLVTTGGAESILVETAAQSSPPGAVANLF